VLNEIVFLDELVSNIIYMRNCYSVSNAIKLLSIPVLVFLFSVVLSSKAYAVMDGDLDTTFQTSGAVSSFNSSVNVVAVQPDGKMLIGGEFTSYKGNSAPHLIRLNSGGTVDTTFALDGVGFDDYVQSIAIQDDGKIIVAGSFSSYNGVEKNDILRLNSDGSLDTTFDAGTGCDTWNNIYTMKLLDDGNILVAGSFVSFNGVNAKYLVRLSPNGSVDTTFAQEGTGLQSYVYSIGIQDDGKYVVGGQFDNYGETELPGVARLNTNGSLDTSFAPFFTNGMINTIAIQDDGKILVGGAIVYYVGNFEDYRYLSLVRLNNDGSEDLSFTTEGKFSLGLNDSNTEIHSILIQSSGKIVISGDFSQYDSDDTPYIARINTDGSLDSSFLHSSMGFNSGVYDLYSGLNGELFATGHFLSYGNATCPYVVSMDANGNIEDTFLQYPQGFNGPTSVIKIQPDGKLLVAGMFTTYKGVYSPGVVRLNNDGTIDETFSQTGSGIMFGEYIYSLAIQDDGKILIGGDIFSYAGIPTPYFLRLNSNGSLDTSFNMGTGFSYEVSNILVQSDGKILAFGYFNSYNGVEVPGSIIRLNSDGSVDTSFNPNQEIEYGTSAAIQEDGKIIVTMQSTYPAPHLETLLRLNSDGSVDTSFNIEASGFNSEVGTIIMLDNGKILIAGNYSTYGGVEALSLARLNEDGSLDTTFSQEIISPDEEAFLVLPTIQPDGKILVEKILMDTETGEFISTLLRLNTDGSLDNTFVVNFTPFGENEGFAYAYDIEIQSDGKVLMVGGFKDYQGNEDVAYIARLNIHHIPDIPSLLNVNGATNPSDLANLIPQFSALLTDTKTTDTLTKYQIQVNTNSLFTGISMWDSGVQTFSTPITSNNRTPNISYVGNALTLDGAKYYWRIRVWDSLNDPSEWSSTNTFTMASYTLNAPFGLAISPSTYSNVNSFRFTWSAGNARVKNYEYKIGNAANWTSTTVTSVNSLQAYKNGQNIVQVRSVDNAGSRSVASAISYYYDSTAPTVPTNLVATDTTFSWTAATDLHSGIYGYEYKVGDTNSWINTESTLISNQLGLTMGENTLYVRAIDKAGNKSEPASIEYTYNNQNQEIDSSDGPQMSFVREGSTSIQSDSVAVKSGESITVTIPVSEITVEGDSVSQVYIEIDGQKTLLILDTEKKVYTAQVSIPAGKTKGSKLQTNQVVEYTSGEKSVKGASIIIDPYGYVYAKSGGKETRLENAQVSLYSYINGQKDLYVFNDGTKNPQNTNSYGEYSYFVPSGKYILVIELDGYKTFTSDVFEVSNGAVEQNIEMKKKLPISVYIIGGGVLLLLCVGVLALKKKEIDY
jgi:uncharacterized delta-60 repeat protein